MPKLYDTPRFLCPSRTTSAWTSASRAGTRGGDAEAEADAAGVSSASATLRLSKRRARGLAGLGPPAECDRLAPGAAGMAKASFATLSSPWPISPTISPALKLFLFHAFRPGPTRPCPHSSRTADAEDAEVALACSRSRSACRFSLLGLVLHALQVHGHLAVAQESRVHETRARPRHLHVGVLEHLQLLAQREVPPVDPLSVQLQRGTACACPCAFGSGGGRVIGDDLAQQPTQARPGPLVTLAQHGE